MGKGRKALPGTHEARESIDLLRSAIDETTISREAKERAKKALKFGLGIKEEITEEKATVQKKKVKTTTENQEDEYFDKGECYEA